MPLEEVDTRGSLLIFIKLGVLLMISVACECCSCVVRMFSNRAKFSNTTW